MFARGYSLIKALFLLDSTFLTDKLSKHLGIPLPPQAKISWTGEALEPARLMRLLL